MIKKASRNTTALSLVVLLSLVAGLASCSVNNYPIPVFDNAPEVVNLNDLLEDYASDPVAAAGKYEDATFIFPSVHIDKIISPLLTPAEYQLGALPHAASGEVVFKPKYLYDLDKLGPDFIVDVYGTVRGWVQKDLFIVDCTFAIAKGGDLPPPGVY